MESLVPPPAGHRGQWLPLLTEAFESWIEQREPRPPSPADASLLDGLAADPLRRGARLHALRERLQSPPLARIHPSWIAHLLPSEPWIRLLCLGTLPASLRAEVARQVGGAAPRDLEIRAGAAAPAWLAEWWRGELRRGLAYPAAPPWHLDRRDPFTFLDRLDRAELDRALPRLGLRAFAQALPALERGEAAGLVFRLGSAEQELLRALSPGQARPTSDGWAAALRRLDGPLNRRLGELALIDLAANAEALGAGEALERLAYRLPRRRGLRLMPDGRRRAAELTEADPETFAAGLRRAVSSCLDDRFFSIDGLRVTL